MGDNKTKLRVDDLMAHIEETLKSASRVDGVQPKTGPAKDKGEDAPDPTDKGTKSVTPDPNAKPDKMGVPPSATNGTAEPTLETKELGAAGVGKGSQPATRDGNADETKTEGIKHATALREKSANLLKVITEAVQTKQASAAAAQPASSEPEKKPAAPESEKKAGEGSPEDIASDIDTSIFSKIAQMVLQHEEGAAFVERIAREQFGAEAADQLIKGAAEAQRYAEEWDAYEKSGAAAMEQYLADPSVPQADKDRAIRGITVHSAAYEKIASEDEKRAYAGGAEIAEAMAPMAGDEAAMAEQMGNPEEIPVEEIILLLQEMAAAGEIDEQTAQMMIAQLQGQGGGGAPAPAEEPPEAAPETPAEEGPPEEVKAAMSKVASAVAESLAEFSQ